MHLGKKRNWKSVTKTVIAVVMSLTIMTGEVPVASLGSMVHAAESTPAQTEKTITGLGTGAISNPIEPGAEGDTKGWTGSYVYYGSYGGIPVKYRVLDTAATEFGGNTMLLDCDSTLKNKAHVSKSPYEYSWGSSEVRAWLNGAEFFGDAEDPQGAFTKAERSAIASSTKAEKAEGKDGDGSRSLGYQPLSDEKIFLLDAVEATRSTYGYQNTDEKDANRKKLGTITWWWLRSPDIDDATHVGVVDAPGTIDSDYMSSTDGVSPAFNLNLSSVIFSSVISGTAGSAGAEYKLTILDDDMNVALSDGGIKREGNVVTVPYSITGNNAGKATQVSVLITDEAYVPGTAKTSGYVYAKLSVDSFGTSGSGTFTLPDAYADKTWGTDYHVYLLAEDIYWGKETDYACISSEILLPAVNATITKAPIANKCLADGTEKALLSDGGQASGGTLYYALGQDKDTEPTADASDTPDADRKWKTSIPAKTEAGTYYVWVKAVGDADHTDSTATCVTVRICFPITFKVVGGTWLDGSSDDKFVEVSRYDDEDLALTLNQTDIPAVNDQVKGSWDEDPAVYITDKTISSEKTFTYTIVEVEGEVKASVDLTGRAWANDDSFEFTISAADGMPMPSKTSVIVTKDSTDKAESFGEILFTKVGEYTYTISQTHKGESIDGISYDSTDKTVTIKVKKDDNGKLVADGTALVQTASFANTYSKSGEGEIKARAVLTGRPWQFGDSFEFTVTPVGNAPSPSKTKVTVTQNSSEQTESFGKITFAEAGEYSYILSQTHAGETIGGVAYDSADKMVTIKVKDDGKGHLVADGTALVQTAEFTNKYGATGSVTISASVAANAALGNCEFTFRLSNKDGYELQGNKSGKQGETVNFDAITYDLNDAGKTFAYKIRQEIPAGAEGKGNNKYEKDGVIYDGEVKEVTVTVSNDKGDGTLDVSASGSPATFTNETLVKSYNVNVVGGSANVSSAADGSTITITAEQPAAGKAFVQWSCSDSSVVFDNPSSTVTTFAMPKSDITVTAVCADINIEGINAGGYTYTGQAIEPAITVSLIGVDWELVKGKDFEVAYQKNEDVGQATLTVTMKAPHAGSKSATFEIKRKAVTITAKNNTKVYDGTELTESGFTATELEVGDTHTFYVTMTADSKIKDCGTKANVIGTVDGVPVTTGVETAIGNYLVTTMDGLLSVNKASLTITAKSEQFTYDGTAHSNAGYDVDGLVGADAVTAVVTGSITYPSEGSVVNKIDSYQFTSGSASNYNVTTVNGALTMVNTSNAITITAASEEWTYDGTAHANNAVTVTSGTLLTGDTLVATATGSVTNVFDTAVGNNPVAAGYKVMHGTQDVTANYVITTQAGMLTVTPAHVEITAKSQQFTYDGTAHSNAGYDVTGLVGDDAITAIVNGSITYPSEGSVVNKIDSYQFTSGSASNYNVTTVNGALTMVNTSNAITITAASEEWTYDGTAHANNAVTVTSGTLFTGDTLVATATGSVTNVVDTAVGNNPVAAGYKVMHGTEDVTANYVITTQAGTLTVTPALVEITAKSDQFTYDGTAHGNAGYDITGLVGEDAITAIVNGSITFPSEGSVVNKIDSYQFTSGSASNYNVTTTNGSLTMVNASNAITITAASEEWTYDGTAHANSEVTVTSGTLFTGDTLVATATGSVTNVVDTVVGNNPVAADYKVMHGTEDVTASYVITAQAGMLTVNPKPISVVAHPAMKEFEAKDPEFKYTVVGLLGSDGMTGTLSREPGEKAGKYEIVLGTLTAGSNYAINYTSAALTILEEDYLNELRRLLTYAIALGGNQTVTWEKGTALPYDVMKTLQDHPQLTLIFKYYYGNMSYEVTIHGKDVVTDPKITWYGPMNLYGRYGLKIGFINPSGVTGSYVVVRGDNLTKIARRLNTSVDWLVKVNMIKNPNLIWAKQVLKY